MTPHFPLAIDVCLRALVSKDNIWLRKTMLIPFVPRKGDVIDLWREDGTTRKVELQAVYWSMKESCFIEEQTDDAPHDAIEAGEEFDEVEYRAEYELFGFRELVLLPGL